MFDIKNLEIPGGNGEAKKLAKTINPGVHNGLIINGLSLFEKESSYNNKMQRKLLLYVETQPVSDPEFEGFYIDNNNHSLGRHAGQVGTIQLNLYNYADEDRDGNRVDPAVWQKSLAIDIIKFATAIGVDRKNEIDTIVASNYNDFVNIVGKVITGRVIDMVVGGNAYMSNGYTNYYLKVVNPKKDGSYRGYGYRVAGDESKALINYDPEYDIFKSNGYLKELEESKNNSATVGSFDIDDSSEGITL